MRRANTARRAGRAGSSSLKCSFFSPLLGSVDERQQRGTSAEFHSSCCLMHSKEPLLRTRRSRAAPVHEAEGLHGVWKCSRCCDQHRFHQAGSRGAEEDAETPAGV